MNKLKIELEETHEKIKNFKQLELKKCNLNVFTVAMLYCYCFSAQSRFLQIPRKSYHLLFAEKKLNDYSLLVDICIMYSIEVKVIIEIHL